jgi:hypothetical protein
MTQLVNPKCEVKILGLDEFTIRGHHLQFDVTKDVEEDPNDATITVYNLNDSQRGLLTVSDLVDTPIELYASRTGSTELVKVFAGEIEDAKNRPMRPGHETRIQCTSQKSSHYSAYVDKLTFEAGTRAISVINALADAVGLPWTSVKLSQAPIPFSQSFSGSAYRQLEKFCRDFGYRVFVLDGALHITSVYEPENTTARDIPAKAILSEPIPRKVIDEQLVERMSTNVIDDMLSENYEKRKKRRKRSKRPGPTDYVTYDAVDKQFEGWDFELSLQPDVQPDDLISVPWKTTKDKVLRVNSVNHTGDTSNFDDWTTRLETVLYEVE